MRAPHAQLDKLRTYLEIAQVGEIARRYAAMNAFDGILTIIGVLTGSYMAGVREARVVVATGLATSVAVGVSGLWGAYLTESAERKRSLDELEESTLSDLSDTRLGRASRFAVIVVALIDGLAPFLASVVVLAPFLLSPLLPRSAGLYTLSIGTGLLSLFALGLFIGSISRQRLLLSGVKTLAAGLLCVALNLLMGVG
ncbi:MAG: hypothetical protein QME94_11820 [Anaerolineae bacterium]|nr:hypothetical protein [Anaerolineae bacterium]